MKTELKPGATLETLTFAELEEALTKWQASVDAKSPIEIPGVYGGTNDARFTTTAGGALRGPLYTVPAGFIGRLFLLSVNIPYASGTPAAQAAASIYVWRNEAPADGGSMAGLLAVGSGLPNALTYGAESAPILRSGETYVLEIRSALNAVNVSGLYQVGLFPIPPKRQAQRLPRHAEHPRELEKVVQ